MTRFKVGLQFKDIVVREEISSNSLKGKVLAVDTMNLLYQFLTTIRGPDGQTLTNSKGKITSHLIGLFSRTTSFMEKGLKLVFVFDGKPPELKNKTLENRTAIKNQALLKLEKARLEDDLASVKKYSARVDKLDLEMIEDAKELISALGLPIIQAPSEGEAQATHLVKRGDAYATVSQDYDNLIFGSLLLIRNLSLEGRRKQKGVMAFSKIKPELISLSETLKKNSIDLDQLIILAIIIGTDYNPGGIKGLGPKKALKLIHEYKKDFTKLFVDIKWPEHFPDLKWQEIYDTIVNMPVSDDYSLVWQQFDESRLRELLIDRFEFSVERVESQLNRLKDGQKSLSQKGLNSFF